MNRIYENRSFARRMIASAIVVALAILFGIFELWQAFNAAPGDAGYGYMFAAFFIFGGIYGFRQIHNDYADTVVSLDADPATARVAMWRPFGAKKIEAPIGALTGWRNEVKATRHSRIDMLVADHPGHPRPLRFETGKGVVTTEAFRALAAEAAKPEPND